MEEVKNKQEPIRFIDLAFTLQIGKEAMEERLSFVASSLDETHDKLVSFLKNGKESKGIFRGNAGDSKKLSDFMEEVEDSVGSTKGLVEKEKLEHLARLWVTGLQVDWKLLYKGDLPRKISLPTYPFSGESYWISSSSQQTRQITTEGKPGARLHPLIDSNESSFDQQVFKKILTQHDLVIRDHVVAKNMVLPGVAYLEIAKCVWEKSSEDNKAVGIRNIRWLKPVVLEAQAKEIFIKLIPDVGGAKCYVSSIDNTNSEVIHAEWEMVSLMHEPGSDEIEEIASLQKICSNHVEKEACYRIFQDNGFEYGPTYRAIEEIWYNHNEALSRLQLPEHLLDEILDYDLHPSLMDSALQTVIAWLNLTGKNQTMPLVPFTMREVQIRSPLPTSCYVHIRLVDRNLSTQADFQKYQIRILDDQGKTRVVIKDHYLRPFRTKQITNPITGQENNYSLLFYQTAWIESKSLQKPPQIPYDITPILLFDIDREFYLKVLNHFQIDEEDQRHIILVQPGNRFQPITSTHYKIVPDNPTDYKVLLDALTDQKIDVKTIIHLWSKAGDCANDTTLTEQLQRGFFSVLYLSAALIEYRPKHQISVNYVFSHAHQNHQPLFEAISGSFRSINREYPKLVFKTIQLTGNTEDEHSPTAETYFDTLIKEFASTVIPLEVKYRQQTRYVRTFQSINPEKPRRTRGLSQTGLLVKEHGVYLITGGLGELGLIFANYIAKQAPVRIVLCGRSEPSSEKRKRITELKKLGSQILYLQANLTNSDAVKKLVNTIKSRFGEINGIFHSAGVIHDSLVQKKLREEVEEVIRPKVHGTIYLDRETRQDPLDFFVLFSSISAQIGYLGQSDYAYANSFLDVFVTRRETQRKKHKRSGRTISINWPWWLDGGMRVDRETEELLEKTMGLKGIATEDALNAFEKGVKAGLNHFMILAGEPHKIENLLSGESEPQAERSSGPMSPVSEAKHDMVKVRLEQELRRIVFEILKIPENKIEFGQNLNTYGFDSITFTKFANKINEIVAVGISPADFYEYPSLGAFRDYLLDEFAGEIAKLDLKDFATQKQDKPLSPVRKRKQASRFIHANEPIAIIGMNGVMPESENLYQFWKHLENKDDLVKNIPPDRWNWKEIFDESGRDKNKTFARRGGFMKEVDKFDAAFFAISPREAELMDPKQRILLESVWKAIEDAGYRPSKLSGTNTGVFIGVGVSDYNEIINVNSSSFESYRPTGICHSVLANRISFLLNLHGPSEPIDTACSSSLVAIHRGMECIRSKRCDLVIAGGINVMLTATDNIAFSKTGMLSRDGKCKTFDEKADGYVRGEGCGVVILKSLRRAEEDRDHIYALIRGGAVNHGGRANSLTAPNPVAQADLLLAAYDDANVDPITISYIEAHGTGTALGDPIEINGLKKAFRKMFKGRVPVQSQKHFCGLGSVKTNVGHLEAAAGMAGIFKLVLAMKHGKLPANIHFSKLNPHIDLKESPFYIVDKTIPWKRIVNSNSEKLPRRAGISSFGFGGTNAHLILEEYHSIELLSEPSDFKDQLILLSAKSRERLYQYVYTFINFLTQFEEAENHDLDRSRFLSDAAYTLQIGRESLECRLAFVVKDFDELREKLIRYYQGENSWNDFFEPENTTKELLQKAIETGDLRQLGKAWVAGADIDWQQLYHTEQRQRVPLPSYPFARVRHWISNPKPHPLLEKQDFGVNSKRFFSTLTGNEFFLTDHVMAGLKVLPAVNYIEMVRAAGELALGKPVHKIRNIIWIQTIAVEHEP
ncbi:MAG: SDR family NAD(P)-dependent oxidoreductase, partial [Desulfobacteraceae bacterium]